MDSESQFVCQRSRQKIVTTYTHWFPSVIKTLFRKKGEAHVLFRFPMTSLESFLHLWSVLQYVHFPLFHIYELVVNFNHYELGLITSICVCLGTVYDFKYFQGLPFRLFEFDDLWPIYFCCSHIVQ